MSKCYLVWGESGSLVCTKQHRIFKNCDLSNLRDEITTTLKADDSKGK